MKNIGVWLLVAVVGHAKAEVELVPLNMELGYWEMTTQVDIEDMLAKVPAEQREMMRSMMTSKMKLPVIKKCITQDTLNNLEAQMKKTFQSAGNDCELEVTKSTAEEFSGVLICADGASKTTITTKSINSKRHESLIHNDMAGVGQNNIKTIGEWKSATCPDGI